MLMEEETYSLLQRIAVFQSLGLHHTYCSQLQPLPDKKRDSNHLMSFPRRTYQLELRLKTIITCFSWRNLLSFSFHREPKSLAPMKKSHLHISSCCPGLLHFSTGSSIRAKTWITSVFSVSPLLYMAPVVHYSNHFIMGPKRRGRMAQGCWCTT